MRHYEDSERNPLKCWGPKVAAAALAASTLAFSAGHAEAATVVAMGAGCQNQGAGLISNPSFVTPDSVNGVGDAVYRVTLSGTGQIAKLTLERSAGDPLLDFTAMHVVRESRFAAALADCRPAIDSFLVSVDFDDN